MKVILCLIDNPAGIYLFKVNRTTRTRCVICSNVSIVNFGQVNAGSETSPKVVNKVNRICSAKCFFFSALFCFSSLGHWGTEGFIHQMLNTMFSKFRPTRGFPNTISSWGVLSPPVRGGPWTDYGGGGRGVQIGGTLACRNQISVKFAFVFSRLTCHKNVCFTVCLNSFWVLWLSNGKYWLLNVKCY